MLDNVITQEEKAIISNTEEKLQQENALEEKSKKKIREFAKLLEENHCGWVDTDIFDKTVPVNIHNLPDEIAAEVKDGGIAREIPQSFFVDIKLPDSIASEKILSKLATIKEKVLNECVGEIVYWELNQLSIKGIIKIGGFTYIDETMTSKLQLRISEICNEVFGYKDGEMEVSLNRIDNWSKIPNTLHLKYLELSLWIKSSTNNKTNYN